MGAVAGREELPVVGGILGLAFLITQHEEETVADFREFFSVSAWDVRAPELLSLIAALLKDPRSRLHSAAAGWSHPISREAIYTLDLIDVLLMRWSEKGKFKPVPRPWTGKPRRAVKRRTADEAMRILRPHKFKS